jgi:hypothetical protein
MTTGRINQVAKPTSTAVMKISPQATVPFLGWFLEFSLSNSGIECKALTLLQFGGNSVFSRVRSHRLYNTPPTYQYFKARIYALSIPSRVVPPIRSTTLSGDTPPQAAVPNTRSPRGQPVRFFSKPLFHQQERCDFVQS